MNLDGVSIIESIENDSISESMAEISLELQSLLPAFWLFSSPFFSWPGSEPGSERASADESEQGVSTSNRFRLREIGLGPGLGALTCRKDCRFEVRAEGGCSEDQAVVVSRKQTAVSIVHFFMMCILSVAEFEK